MRAASGPAWWWRHAGIPTGGALADPAAPAPAAPFPQSPLPTAVDLYMFGNWVEVTRLNNSQAGVYARDAVTIVRGRSSEGGAADPTAITFTLNNRDGRYTPKNPTGPYYGQIGRNTQARVRVGNDVRGVGEVVAWPPKWTPGGQDVWTPIQAAGILRRLGQSGPLRSAPVRYYPDTSPVAYWPMEDGPLAGYAAPLAGGDQLRPFTGTHPSGAVVTLPKFGQGELAPWLPPAVTRTGGAGLTILYAAVAMPAFTNTWTIDMAYNSGTDAASSTIDINPSYLPGGAAGWPQVILTPASSLLQVTMNAEPEVDATVTGLFDSAVHHIRWTATQSATKVAWAVYVDGVARNTGTTAGAMTLAAARSVGLVASASTGGDMIQGHVAVWAGNPPAVATAAAAIQGWDGETATDRMTRLCAEEGVPLTVVTDADGTTPGLCGPQRTTQLVDLLRAAGDADGGILYEPRAVFGLAYRTVASLYNQPVALALDYTGAGELAPPLEPVDDDRTTRNDVTVTRQFGGTAQVTVDDGPLSTQDPPDGVGRYPATVTLDVASEAQSLDGAGWLAHLGTVDEYRYPQINLNLAHMATHGKQALADQAAALDIGGRLTITNPPAWLPPDDVDQLAQGFTETLSQYVRAIAVNGAPASAWTVAVYDSAAYAYSPDGSYLAAGIDAAVTTFLVSTPSGPLWMTAADWASSGSPPFNISVGGEVMLVTSNGTSGASSPQTFAVIRSINGVVKSHPAGEQVTVSPPAVYAL